MDPGGSDADGHKAVEVRSYVLFACCRVGGGAGGEVQQRGGWVLAFFMPSPLQQLSHLFLVLEGGKMAFFRVFPIITVIIRL